MLQTAATAEQELIRRCKNGDLKYQELLYKQFYGFAMGVGLRYLANRDDALEVVNDAFIKVFKSIKKFDDALPFKPWLKTVVLHTAIDLRRKNRQHEATLELENTMEISAEPPVLASLTAADILKLMDLLPELHRLVFNLYEVDGYNHEEIAGMLQIQVSSSRVYLSRAKDRLRKLILIQNQ